MLRRSAERNTFQLCCKKYNSHTVTNTTVTLYEIQLFCQVSSMQSMLEETLTKNLHLQQDLENMSQVRVIIIIIVAILVLVITIMIAIHYHNF